MMWRRITDFCRLQRVAKLLIGTAIFLFVNSILDLRFSQSEANGSVFSGEISAHVSRVKEPVKAESRLVFHRGLSFTASQLQPGAQNVKPDNSNKNDNDNIPSSKDFKLSKPSQDFVIHMSARLIESKGGLRRAAKFGTRFEVSHTAPPEPFIVINESYFVPRSSLQNDFQFSYYYRPTCSDIFLLILTCSKHEHFQYRRAIRDTWGSIGLYHKKIKLVFLLGQHYDTYWNENVLKEANTFEDILVTNTRESYENLTLKVLAGLNWSKTNCRAQYILKSDEDMVINVPFLAKVLKLQPMQNAILGSVNFDAPVMRTNKWKVERDLYPYSVYPAYVSGNSYVLSFDAAINILDVFRYMPLISVEDAFITGILAKVAGVKLVADKRFTYWGTPMITVCEYVQNRMISGTHMTPKILYRMWKAISKRKCS